MEIVQGIYDAWQRGDVEGALEPFDEQVEWFGPPDISRDAEGLVRGHEGVRRSLARWMGTWDDYSYELCELIDSGDRVLAGGRQSGRGRGSGVEISEEIFSVWTLKAGKIVRQRMFRERAAALEAAGLSE